MAGWANFAARGPAQQASQQAIGCSAGRWEGTDRNRTDRVALPLSGSDAALPVAKPCRQRPLEPQQHRRGNVNLL